MIEISKPYVDLLWDLRTRLEGAGFQWHQRQDYNPREDYYERGQAYWYSWVPVSDVEVGPDCKTHEAAILSALDALIDHWRKLCPNSNSSSATSSPT